MSNETSARERLLHPTSKADVAVFLAAFILCLNVYLAVDFISKARRYLALQASIKLPVAKTEPEEPPAADVLKLTIRTDGSVFTGDIPLPTDDSLASLIRSRAPTHVKISIEKGAKYDEVRSLLRKLGQNGINNVTVGFLK